MVVAARGERFLPRARAAGLDALPLGHFADHFRREAAEDSAQQVDGAAVARAVDQLEPREQQQQPLELVDRQPAVDAEEHVRHRTDDVFDHQIFLEAIDVGPQVLDHAELFLVDAADEDVDLGPVLREIGSDFVGDERARQMGDLQRP